MIRKSSTLKSQASAINAKHLPVSGLNTFTSVTLESCKMLPQR